MNLASKIACFFFKQPLFPCVAVACLYAFHYS